MLIMRHRSTWRDIFSDPLVSVDGLRAGALSKYGIGESDAQGGVVLRSVYWRVSRFDVRC
jgi:TBC1 domain family protein 5